jgi:hypothetical protein
MTADIKHPRNFGESIHLLVAKAQAGGTNGLDPRLPEEAVKILRSPDVRVRRSLYDGVVAQGYPEDAMVVFVNKYLDTVIVRSEHGRCEQSSIGSIMLVSTTRFGPEDYCQNVFLYESNDGPEARRLVADEMTTGVTA